YFCGWIGTGVAAHRVACGVRHSFIGARKGSSSRRNLRKVTPRDGGRRTRRKAVEWPSCRQRHYLPRLNTGGRAVLGSSCAPTIGGRRRRRGLLATCIGEFRGSHGIAGHV